MPKNSLICAVLGAGTMGHGIAQVLALAGHEVRLFDPEPRSHEKARQAMAKSLALLVELGLNTKEQASSCLERISFHADLAPACTGADLVLESAPEDMNLKKSLYDSVEDLIAPQAILATNTSALSIS